jgi:hypothetical protein
LSWPFLAFESKTGPDGVTPSAVLEPARKLGIAKCLEMISGDFRFNEKLDYFNQHKKKDDLSDSFLQGMWFINNKKL